MVNRVDRRKLDALPKAVESDGILLCPLCWHPLAEPIEGRAKAAVWCRTCKKHVLLSITRPQRKR